MPLASMILELPKSQILIFPSSEIKTFSLSQIRRSFHKFALRLQISVGNIFRVQESKTFKNLVNIGLKELIEFDDCNIYLDLVFCEDSFLRSVGLKHIFEVIGHVLKDNILNKFSRVGL